MDPPNPIPIDMRKTKLKPEEAALIAGELVKPSWASRNEGIHERVSFEDTLWGFEMAGGKFYNTPLRVVYVRPGSRAEHACIRMGDTVLKISGRDTSDLTLQEAHQLVLDAGIDLKIVVTAPEDKENAHFSYQDPMMVNSGPTAEQLREMEMERVRRALERASRCRELPWPWVRKNWTIYRESNCYMVPSKYENKHRDKFPELPPEKLDFFFPAEQIKRGKKYENNMTKSVIENTTKTKLEDVNNDEEYEEVEEEVEEEETNEENDVTPDNSNERLDDSSIEKIKDNSTNKDLNDTDSSANHLEEQQEAANGTSLENIQRKDSDQSSGSNYELDNNNNHVVKNKKELGNDTNLEGDLKSDDQIINEIVQNSSEVDLEENVLKSDDDILDSVLNDNLDSVDSQNER